ncbi:MAG: hypothetical protein JW395_3092 [Nitrospira sp.]|nr:hypothetical protein [Nitrospira sp.]
MASIRTRTTRCHGATDLAPRPASATAPGKPSPSMAASPHNPPQPVQATKTMSVKALVDSLEDLQGSNYSS